MLLKELIYRNSAVFATNAQFLDAVFYMHCSGTISNLRCLNSIRTKMRMLKRTPSMTVRGSAHGF